MKSYNDVENQTMKLIKTNIPFTMVANEVLRSEVLSWKAKGLYAYLFSKPEGWDFAGDRIVKEGLDKRHSVFAGLRELEEKGYLRRQRHPSGRVEYHLLFSENPDVGNQQMGLLEPLANNRTLRKSPLAKISTVSNTDVDKNRLESNTDSKTEVLQGKQWNSLIDPFQTINPMFADFYRNKTERRALHEMCTKIGYEKLLATIIRLPEITSKPFAPKITKPSELRRDFGKLLSFVKQERSKISRNVIL